MLIYNKYDGVTGKTLKNFFCKAEIHRKTKSLSRFFFDVRSWQLQSKSNSPPIQVQSKSNSELEENCLCNVIDFSERFYKVNPLRVVSSKSVLYIRKFRIQQTSLSTLAKFIEHCEKSKTEKAARPIQHWIGLVKKTHSHGTP